VEFCSVTKTGSWVKNSTRQGENQSDAAASRNALNPNLINDTIAKVGAGRKQFLLRIAVSNAKILRHSREGNKNLTK
jgi:hypothetical protein